METSYTQALRAIEVRAQGAIVQELRIMTEEVVALCPSLNAEDRAYADGLLLKLDRLIGDQRVLPECVSTASVHRVRPRPMTQSSHDTHAAQVVPVPA